MKVTQPGVTIEKLHVKLAATLRGSRPVDFRGHPPHRGRTDPIL